MKVTVKDLIKSGSMVTIEYRCPIKNRILKHDCKIYKYTHGKKFLLIRLNSGLFKMISPIQIIKIKVLLEEVIKCRNQ